MKKPGGMFTKCLKIFFNLFYLFFFITEYNFMSKIDHSLNLCNCFPTAQPAGIPEILKKSLHSCSVRGGEEVFIIGKNFLKDTKVIFQENVAGEANFCHLSQNLHRIVLFSAENVLFFCCCSRWKLMEGRSWNWHGTVSPGRLRMYFL